MSANWIDLALLDKEADVEQLLQHASAGDRAQLRGELSQVLGISEDAIERATLRLLIERARPLALPGQLWRRPIGATSSIRDASRRHLLSLGLGVTPARLAAMQNLYARFAEDRQAGLVVTPSALRAQNFRCGLCGLGFYNDELVDLAITSPLGNRPHGKTDPLKPHWSKPAHRKPRLDHVCPISMYGGNSADNFSVICEGCNTGKANYMASHQTRPFVGLPWRDELQQSGTVRFETFFAQMRRQPVCQLSGRDCTQVELTIQVRDARYPPVLDNLVTVASEDT